jgi:MarR family transcriptional regulator, organic hydroperoxide resistance regulator
MDNIQYCNAISELLRNIDSKLSRLTNQHFSSQNLTASSISILLLLDKKGALRIGDIAEELQMVDSNVSAICSRLENIGLIERIRLKDDRRIVKIQLTKTALDKMENITSSVNKFQKSIIGQVSENDFEDIIRGLTKLNNLLDKAIGEEKQ